ncbi:MAG: sulfotransferase [Phycisphaeraceae bacterium]|nr:sulfotransferase [Phycisphaeraceae bacterium]
MSSRSARQVAIDAPRRNLTYALITGNRRSGTTWLCSMLSTHPAVMIKNEGRLLRDEETSAEHWLDRGVLDRWAALPSARGGWLAHVSREELEPILVRGMLESLMHHAAMRSPWKNYSELSVIGEKSTIHALRRLDLLRRVLPDARLVNVVRDGRDTVVSDMFFRFAHRAFDGFPGGGPAHARAAYRYHVEGKGPAVPLFDRDTLTSLTSTWVESIENAQHAAAAYAGRFLEVRYEQLVADPIRVAGVLDFLGVQSDAQVLANCVERNRFQRVSGGRQPGEADPRDPVARKGVVGDWRAWMTPEDRRVFLEVAGSWLVRLGYEPDDAWVDASPAPPGGAPR